MLEKETINDKIEVINNGTYPFIQVRTATIIKEDGEVISKNFHRHVLNPDADIAQEDQDVASVAASVFTLDVKKTYADYLAQLADESTPKIAAEVVE